MKTYYSIQTDEFLGLSSAESLYLDQIGSLSKELQWVLNIHNGTGKTLHLFKEEEVLSEGVPKDVKPYISIPSAEELRATFSISSSLKPLLKAKKVAIKADKIPSRVPVVASSSFVKAAYELELEGKARLILPRGKVFSQEGELIGFLGFKTTC